jgi:hypothetical protein
MEVALPTKMFRVARRSTREHYYVIQSCLWLTPDTWLGNKQVRTAMKTRVNV